MLFLDVIYVEGSKGAWFCWVKAPTSAELTVLAHTMAQRIGRFLQRQCICVFHPTRSTIGSIAKYASL